MIGQLDHIASIAVGANHVCALREGEIWCWGDNQRKQISGSVAYRTRPERVVGMPASVAIFAAGDTSCALSKQREVWCWGQTLFSSALDITTAVPRKIDGLRNVRSITVAGATICALQDDDNTQCLGSLSDLIRRSNWASKPEPLTRAGSASRLTLDKERCVLHREGTVSCWIGQRTPRAPVSRASALASDNAHLCAVVDPSGRCAAGQLAKQRKRFSYLNPFATSPSILARRAR